VLQCDSKAEQQILPEINSESLALMGWGVIFSTLLLDVLKLRVRHTTLGV